MLAALAVAASLTGAIGFDRVDYNRKHARLQATADSAALAGAAALATAQSSPFEAARAAAQSMVGKKATAMTVVPSAEQQSVSVQLSRAEDGLLHRILHRGSRTLTVRSTAHYVPPDQSVDLGDATQSRFAAARRFVPTRADAATRVPRVN